MKGQIPKSVPVLNPAFPYEKPQVERSEAPMFTRKHVYGGVFHRISILSAFSQFSLGFLTGGYPTITDINGA
jgi:hypothetical protein